LVNNGEDGGGGGVEDSDCDCTFDSDGDGNSDVTAAVGRFRCAVLCNGDGGGEGGGLRWFPIGPDTRNSSKSDIIRSYELLVD